MGEGHEVRFAERHFVPRHAAGIEEIRDAVDALQVKRRLAPEAPLPPLPTPPAAAPQVREDFRAALAPLVEGELVAVEVVYRAGRGDVVEARTASGQRRLFVVTDGVARPADDIESRIDALPAPEAPPAPPPASPNLPQPPPASSEPEKKPSRFSFGRGKKDAPPASEPPQDEKPKKRFGFGKRS